MGYEHSADISHCMARLRKGAFDPAHGNSGVDQNIRLTAGYQKAIPTGTACENIYLHQLIEMIFSPRSDSSGTLTTSMSAPRALSLPTKFS